MIRLRISVLTRGTQPNQSGISEEIPPFDVANDILVINRKFIAARCSKVREQDIYGINAYIDCKHALIDIDDFDYFSLMAFANSAPSMSNMRVKNAKQFFRLVGLQIHRLDSDTSNALVVGSDIEEMNVGINRYFESYREQNKVTWTDADSVDTDIRESSIHRLRLFSPHRKLSITGSNIAQAVLETYVKKVDSVWISQASKIDSFSVGTEIDQLHVLGSRIESLIFTNQAKVTLLDLKGSAIERAHHILPQAFAERSMDIWQLVLTSAREERNESQMAVAAFEYMVCRRKSLPRSVEKLGYWAIEKLTGYGYRPFRTIAAAATACFLFGLAFFFSTFHNWNGLHFPASDQPCYFYRFGYSIYLSLITFTTVGYGDVYPATWIARVIACVEAFSGVTLGALFIFALTKRYSGLD